MQIVIELPEKTYHMIMAGQYDYGDMNIIIQNSTLLHDKLNKIKAEIERLHYHPKLDFIRNDEVVDMTLDIIDKYKAESEDE